MTNNETMRTDFMDEDTQREFKKFQKFQQMMKPSSSSQFLSSYGTHSHQLNPTPLGLFGFALTTFVASMYHAGVAVPVDAVPGVLMGLAFVYGGIIQLIAGLLEYRNGNNLNGLILSSYGGYWLSVAVLHINYFGFLASYSNATVMNNAMGVFLLAWTLFSLLMLISVLRTNWITIAILAFLVLTFILLTASKFLDAHQDLQRASGAFGIITSLFAAYSAMAHLLNKMDWFVKLPLFEVKTSTVMND